MHMNFGINKNTFGIITSFFFFFKQQSLPKFDWLSLGIIPGQKKGEKKVFCQKKKIKRKKGPTITLVKQMTIVPCFLSCPLCPYSDSHSPIAFRIFLGTWVFLRQAPPLHAQSYIHNTPNVYITPIFSFLLVRPLCTLLSVVSISSLFLSLGFSFLVNFLLSMLSSLLNR